MNLPRTKPSYQYLKQVLETTKYQLEYQKSKIKHLTPTNRLRLNSNRHTRTNSGCNFKGFNPNEILESSIIIHSKNPSHLSESINTCLASSNLTQMLTQSDNVEFEKSSNSEISKELELLKIEIEGLKEDVCKVKNAVSGSRIKKKIDDFDKENRNDPFLVKKLQEKIWKIRDLNEGNR